MQSARPSLKLFLVRSTVILALLSACGGGERGVSRQLDAGYRALFRHDSAAALRIFDDLFRTVDPSCNDYLDIEVARLHAMAVAGNRGAADEFLALAARAGLPTQAFLDMTSWLTQKHAYRDALRLLEAGREQRPKVDPRYDALLGDLRRKAVRLDPQPIGCCLGYLGT